MKDAVQLRRSGRSLMLKGRLRGIANKLELRIASDRNRAISKFTDRSPYDVNQTDRYIAGPRVPIPGREIWWPVIDVELDGRMTAVAEFEGKLGMGKYAVNAMFYDDTYPLVHTNRIQSRVLTHWENSVSVIDSEATLARFYVSAEVELDADGELEFEVTALSDAWSGRLSLWQDGRELVSIDVIESEEQDRSKESKPGEPLEESLLEAITYILRSQNRDPQSPSYGGLYLFYDHDARTFRQNAWIWPWGPAIHLLLQAADWPAAIARFGRSQLVQAAKLMGEATLRFRVTEEEHPGEGLIVCRFDPGTQHDHGGYTGFISPADTLFLAGWGWAPLYEKTGDARYLDAMISAARASDRILQGDVLIKQDYLTKERYWVDHTLDESGFGLEGFAELVRLTGDPEYGRMGELYMERMLTCLERPDGLWERDWNRKQGGPSPTNCNTRGMGWAMEGLMAAHRMRPEGPYLAKAERMAEHLLKHQLPDGGWAFEFDKPREFLGMADKGTALWALLLGRLGNATGEEKYKLAASRAMEWCRNEQYRGPNTDGHGGIIACSPASGVIYRPFFRMSCAYASAFYGVGVWERLQEQEAIHGRS